MPDPTPLHTRICGYCKKPITKGQLFRDIRGPTGSVPMLEACLEVPIKKKES